MFGILCLLLKNLSSVHVAHTCCIDIYRQKSAERKLYATLRPHGFSVDKFSIGPKVQTFKYLYTDLICTGSVVLYIFLNHILMHIM